MKIVRDVFIHLEGVELAQLVVSLVHQLFQFGHVDVFLSFPLLVSRSAALTISRALVPAALVDFVDRDNTEPVVLFLRRFIIRQLRDVDATGLIWVRLQLAVLIETQCLQVRLPLCVILLLVAVSSGSLRGGAHIHGGHFLI